MSREKPDVIQQGGRWLRVGILVLTTVGPAFNTLLEWLRRRSQEVNRRTSDLQLTASDAGNAALQQLGDFTQESRQFMAERADYLQRQARQLNAQAAQLRGALRREKKQRIELNKTVEQLRRAGVDWSQDLLARGESLKDDLLARGGKISSDLFERAGEVSGDLGSRGSDVSSALLERGGKLRHDLMARGSQLTEVLARRGSETGLDLADRSEQLLQPVARKRRTSFWTIIGFSAGLLTAATATYLLIRRNLLQQEEAEQGQQIELPQDQALDEAITARPAGAIRHIDGNGNSVATLQAVNAGQRVEAPADAAYMGVVSTKLYYPVTADVAAKDVVFFVTEEEAKSEGFTRAATE